jgi:hypothetical protein
MSNVKRDANADKGSDRDPTLGRHGPKLRLEPLDNVSDRLGSSLQRTNNPAVFDPDAPFSERYKGQDARIHYHVCGGLQDFCAVFQYSGPLDDNVRRKGLVDTETAPHQPLSSISDNLDDPVFVRVVYLLEPIEGVRGSFQSVLTSSVVWLQPLDHCLMFVAESLDLFSPIMLEMGDEGWLSLARSSASPTLRISDQEDGELRLTQCLCIRPIGFGNLIHDSVESRPEIMRDLSDTHSPIERKREIALRAIDVISRLRIQLRPDNLMLAILPQGVLSLTEQGDLTFCTPHLETWAIERMHELLAIVILCQ